MRFYDFFIFHPSWEHAHSGVPEWVPLLSGRRMRYCSTERGVCAVQSPDLVQIKRLEVRSMQLCRVNRGKYMQSRASSSQLYGQEPALAWRYQCTCACGGVEMSTYK
jgi:hypothetical protein